MILDDHLQPLGAYKVQCPSISIILDIDKENPKPPSGRSQVIGEQVLWDTPLMEMFCDFVNIVTPFLILKWC